MNKKIICLSEIILVISIVFTFSYLIYQSSNTNDEAYGESKSIKKIREIALSYLSKGLVSAQEGLWTCLEDLNGTICQEYPAQTCNDMCTEDCFPGRREDFSECRLGTCMDPVEGTCSANSPIAVCEDSGGNWFEQEPPECRPGCCLIGGNANYITEQACNILSDRLGQESRFEQVDNELQCLLMGENQEQGACVLGEVEPGLHDCKFGTKENCLSLGGEFFVNKLCTNQGLNTICQIAEQTSCFADKDEVYFVDSCGNKANIYDYSKKDEEDYWNQIVSKNESCSLNGNQAECGNCDYLLGSTCGTPIEGKDEEARLGDFVCRDLSCIDEWKDERKNGESWCAYEGRIGVVNADGTNKGRSVDLPGSGHYRKVCLDGEVRVEQCAEFRNEICVESRDEDIGFSSSACVINSWQSCIEANTDKTKLDKCETNSDCFLKKVRINNFKFDVCAPKYPEGFDLHEDFGGEVGESICSLGSQVCRVVEVKGFGGWKCKANCDCKKPGFAQTMNNLCISLGDCGGNVNVEGQFTSDGYKVKKSPKLGQSYINELISYAEPIKGQRAEPKPLSETAALFGLDINDPEFESKFANAIGMLGIGATGVSIATYCIALGGCTFLTSGAGLQVSILSWGPTWNAFASYAGAGAAGAAIGYVVGKLLGIEGDGLLAVTIAGVFAGLASYTGFFGAFGGNALFSTGFFVWTIIIVLIFALIIKFLGIGDSRIIKVSFTCNPWQPPLGGSDCEKCGEDEFPCTKYKCQSLGQACEFVNEGTGEEACINVAPDDVKAPIISPNYDAVREPFEYSDVNANGFKVIHNELECIPAYTQVTFGVSLDESGQCKYDTLHTANYEEMEFFFGESSLFKKNHVTAISLPSLESLGEGGFDPSRRADFNLFVRCQDKNGNANSNEYNIQFCVSPENDITPPIINRFNPESPNYVSLNAIEQNLTFYTNEPAECKYSDTDTDYSLMQNSVACNNDVEDMTLFGFECNTTLGINSGNETNYYFRCKDKPWETDESKRNTNNQGIKYEIVRTQDPLIIEDISVNPEPDENRKILTGNEPVRVELTVKTAGGAPVERFCEYKMNNGNYIRFFQSGEDEHKQIFSTLFEGNYNILIRCEDLAGNAVEGSTAFSIEVDDEGPRITRVYSQGNSLYVVTNEESMCYYDFNSCSFNTAEGIGMSGRELLHNADFRPNIDYYIKCKDNFGNVGECLNVKSGY